MRARRTIPIPTSPLENAIPWGRIIKVVLLRAMTRRKLETMPVFFRTSLCGGGRETAGVSSSKPHWGGTPLRVTTSLGAIR